MRFRIYLKDPDGFYEGIRDAVESVMSKVDLPEDEWADIFDSKREKLEEQLKRWVEYSEYITIEFDTDKGTAVVVPL